MHPACSRWLRAMAAVRAQLADCANWPTPQKVRRRIVQVADVLRDHCGWLTTAVADLRNLDPCSLASIHPAICTSLSEVLTNSLSLLSCVLPADCVALDDAAKINELSSWSGSELRSVSMVVELFAGSLKALHLLSQSSDVEAARELQVVVALLPFHPCHLLASSASLFTPHWTLCIPPAKAFMCLFMCAVQSPQAAVLLQDELRTTSMLQLACDVAVRVLNGELDDTPRAAADGLNDVYSQLVKLSYYLAEHASASVAASSHASPECVMWRWCSALPDFGQVLLQGLKHGRRLHARLSSAGDKGVLLFTKLMAVTTRWLIRNEAVSKEALPCDLASVSTVLQTSPGSRSSHVAVTAGATDGGGGGAAAAAAAAAAASSSGDATASSPLITALHVSGTLQAVEAFGFLTAGVPSMSIEQCLWEMQPDRTNHVLYDTCRVITLMWQHLDRRSQSITFIPAVTFVQRILRCALTSEKPRGPIAAGRGADGGLSPRASPVVATAIHPSHLPSNTNTHTGRPVWAGQPPHAEDGVDGDRMSLVLPYMALALVVGCVEPSTADGAYRAAPAMWHGLQSRAEWVARSGALSTCEKLLRDAALHGPYSFGSLQLPIDFGYLAFRLALTAALQLPVEQRASSGCAPPTHTAQAHAAPAHAQSSAEQAHGALHALMATLRKLIVRHAHHAAGVHVATLGSVLRPLCLLSVHGLAYSADHGAKLPAASNNALRVCVAQLLLPTVRYARACVCVHYTCDHAPCTYGCNEVAHEKVFQHLRAVTDLATTLHQRGLADVTRAAGVPALLQEMLRASVECGSNEARARRVVMCCMCWEFFASALRHAGWRDEVQRQDLMGLVVEMACGLSNYGARCRAGCVDAVSLRSAPHLLALLPPLSRGQRGHRLEVLASCMRSAHATCYTVMAMDTPVEPSQCRTLLRCEPSWDACLCIAATAMLSPLRVEVDSDALRPPAAVFVGCWYRGCGNVDGASEAALQLRRCSGCRLARYCCEMCQRRAWVGGHREVCNAWRQRL